MKFKTLKEVVEKPITGEWGTEGDGVKVLRTTNFTNEGKVNFAKVVKRNIDSKKVAKKKLRKGDIIIEKSGGSPKQPVGRVIFFDSDGDYLCNNFTAVLRPKMEHVHPKYLLYILFANHKYGFTSAYQNKTTGIINLQLPKYLEGTKIPLPPLPEQRRIAELLDEADKLCQLNNQLITKYNNLTQSLFLDMFGDTKFNEKKWEELNLEDVCSHIIDCPHSTPKYVDEITEFPCIRTTELKNGDIDWTKMKYLNEEGYLNRVKRMVPQYGDLVYGREGTFGDAIIIPLNVKVSLGQRVVLFRPIKTIVTSKFLQAVIRSKGVYHQALRVNSGSTVGHVNIKDIRKFKIINPPITLQNEFAERVVVIEAQKAQAQQSLVKAEELFGALLQRCFGSAQHP